MEMRRPGLFKCSHYLFIWYFAYGYTCELLTKLLIALGWFARNVERCLTLFQLRKRADAIDAERKSWKNQIENLDFIDVYLRPICG